MAAESPTDLRNSVPRPPQHWERRTVAVLVALAASVLTSLLSVVLDVQNWLFWNSDGHGGRPALVSAFVRFDTAYGLVLFVVVVAYIWTFAVWHRATSRVLRVVDGRPATGTHWTVIVWRVSLVFCLATCAAPGNLLIASTRSTAPDQASGMILLIGNYALLSALLLAVQVMLLAGVWQRRAQVRERVVAAGVRMQHKQESPRESPIVAEAGAQWSTGVGRTADDSFWLSVRDLARAAGADLVLLEESGPFAHRWLLVPASGDVSAVRADLAPGARVTVFPQPPSAAFSAPTAGPPFHGFADGAYRSVAAPRVKAFLAQAAGPGRYGLYSPHDPNALRATI